MRPLRIAFLNNMNNDLHINKLQNFNQYIVFCEVVGRMDFTSFYNKKYILEDPVYQHIFFSQNYKRVKNESGGDNAYVSRTM